MTKREYEHWLFSNTDLSTRQIQDKLDAFETDQTDLRNIWEYPIERDKHQSNLDAAIRYIQNNPPTDYTSSIPICDKLPLWNQQVIDATEFTSHHFPRLREEQDDTGLDKLTTLAETAQIFIDHLPQAEAGCIMMGITPTP